MREGTGVPTAIFPSPHYARGETMPQANCPTCHNWFDVDETPALPFCSERCQLIDLGRWMDERFAVPVQRHEEFEDDQEL